MTVAVEQLLEEFVGRWTRDEPLGVDDLLVRAGTEADELAALIDRFLERAPRREPTPGALAFVRSLDDPPLLRARQARGLKLDDLTSSLVARLGLPTGAASKVRRYYQQLELGQLDPSGIASSVWDGLAALLGRDARALAGVALPRPRAPAMYRTADLDAPLASLSPVREQRLPDVDEPDEVDRLFGISE